MGSFRELIAWQKAMDLVDSIYDAVRVFPKTELFGLTQQMKSAAKSIPCNIAEGRGRYSIPDYRHFLREARGSAHELETEIEIAKRQKFMTQETAHELIKRTHEVCRLINGLLRSLGPSA